MKEWPLPADRTDGPQRDGIVLVGLGSGDPAGAGGLPPLGRVTHQLAALLGRPVLALDPEAGPDAAQLSLAAQARNQGGGWLAGLEVDVGLPLADGRRWAEALGDWRQPAVLVIPAAQLTSGLPAAATALLRQWRVPLVGLLQWGGAWQEDARLQDGLPWLGQLARDATAEAAGTAPAEEEAATRLAAAVALRWRQLTQA